MWPVFAYIMDQNLVRQFSDINKRLYNEAASPLRCHGLDHHLRVLHFAYHLISQLNLKVDDQILIPACLLHDISAYNPDQIGQEEHHEVSAMIAKKELELIKYSAEKITKILLSIKSHGTGHRPKTGAEFAEASLLRDADKMDSFGKIGVSRIIMAETRRGRTLQEISQKWTKHLPDKWNSLTFSETKNIIKEEYFYSQKFFDQLAKELNNE